MRVFDENKNNEIFIFDLEKGYLKDDKLFIAFHQKILPVAEVGHLEVEKEYPNGGKDMKWVVDIPAVEGKEAWTEYEDIQVYVPYTTKELAQRETLKLKGYLSSTDYQAIKYAEGALSEEEYAEMKAQRQAWRDRINELESEVET